MRRTLTYLLPLLLLLSSCRDEQYVDYSEEEQISGNTIAGQHYAGAYLLNEGNMGSNHCTLDLLDLTTATYHRNIYGQRNPTVVKELGDVGNDMQIYGSKLWMVINASNKVEVADAATAHRIGQVNIPNSRYVTFHEKFAYISSYVGPIQITGDAPLGRIYQVDTLSLQIVDSVTVGYQPEEMVVIGEKLYVANSGGYRKPNYDNRISVIDLSHFSATPKHLEVGINLHRIQADRFGKLWVSSRGDYKQQQGQLYCLAPDLSGEMRVIDKLDIPVAAMQIVGDTLWYLASAFDEKQGTSQAHFGIVDVRTRIDLSTTLFDAPEIASMSTPYSLAINLSDKDFYLMDARNYVSSGMLLHFLPDGTFDWSVRTGDIPSRMTFVKSATATSGTSEPQPSANHITVLEYRPAPGQFINTLPLYEDGDNAESMAQKCTDALNQGELVCLGGFGGSLTFRFGSSIQNHEGKDFCIYGNAIVGNSEPGIVEVSVDVNGNGLADDPWYELAGSADTDSIGKSHYGYEVTYTANPMHNIPWSDNLGGTGEVERNNYHQQEYFPRWLSSPLKVQGTLLPRNSYLQGTTWHLNALRYGYVDNLPGKTQESCGFDLSWAVDPISRKPVALQRADFIRVYTAVNQSCGWIGETSTEISGAEIVE